MRLFIFGIGYTAEALIRMHRQRFSFISGTVRTQEKAQLLRKRGISAHVFDDKNSNAHALLEDIASADAILASIPPNPTGDPAFAYLAKGFNACPQWIGYLSTIGVYGDHADRWVDEASPTLTRIPHSQHRLVAEKEWQTFAAARQARYFIFRLPGIYGPSRNSLCNFARGSARIINKPGHVFNRAHVEDIAAAIAATFPTNVEEGIYNIVDDEPASQADVIRYAARLMGVVPPQAINYEEAQLSETARRFYLESKRVMNAKLKSLPNFNLRYPTYREGLRSLFQQGEDGL